MLHYSKRSSFAEKVLFSRKKKRKKKRDLTTSTSHSFSNSKRCSLRFFSAAAAREAREAALRAASRFSSLLAAASRFAAVSMETAALRVQEAKSCSRVTRALLCGQTNSHGPHVRIALVYIFSFTYTFSWHMHAHIHGHTCLRHTRTHTRSNATVVTGFCSSFPWLNFPFPCFLYRLSIVYIYV